MVTMELERQVDLTVQLVLLGMLLYGSWLLRSKKNMRGHALIFTAATIINLMTFFLFMVLPFLNEWGEVTASPLVHTFFMLVHHAVGLVALVLSIFVVGRWAAKGFNPQGCKGKSLMYATFGTWFGALGLGVVLFLVEPG
jgi:hypothetical protein